MSLWHSMFRRRRDRDLKDEIDAHFQMAMRDRLERGEEYAAALQAVRREFGGELLVQEVTREMWGRTWFETLAADVRYASRILRKNPGWALAVIISLALGVGANSAIFSLTYAVLLKSLPVPNPGELIRYTFRNGNQDIGLSGPAFDSLRRHQTAATDLLAWSDAEFAIDEHGEAGRVKGGLLSGNGFQVLQLKPLLGRPFAEKDDTPGGGPRGFQALLSYAWWKTHFHESEAVVGQSLTVNGRTVTISGVLPPGFDGLIAGSQASIVLPLAFEEAIHVPRPIRTQAGAMWLTVMGRLKRRESLGTAQVNLSAVEPAVREEADPTHRFLAGFFRPFHFGVESGRGGRSFLKVTYERPLLVLEMLAGLLLILCCTNTALLVLAQVGGRTREFGLRCALGAKRMRIVRQILLEILLLGIPGLALAVAMGWALARSLVAMLGDIGEGPSLQVTPNAAILGFAAGLTILAALSAGLWSAIRASNTDPALNLKAARAGSPKKTGTWIVPAQVAVSVTLIASTLLLGTSFLRLYSQKSGFQTEGVLLADVDLRAAKLSDKRAAQTAQQIVDTLLQTPGIESASVMSLPPLRDWWSAAHYFSVDQRGVVHTDMTTWAESVSTQYFSTIGTRVLQGQVFQPTSRASDNICILSESAAKHFFPNQAPLGQLVYTGGERSNDDGKHLDPKDSCRVQGVVENAYFRSLREAPPRMIYKLFSPDGLGSQFSVAIRSHNEAQAAGALRDALRRLAPQAPTPALFSFTDIIDIHLMKERMLIRLSASFAACALLLTAIGLYGLLMRSVMQRRREIGVRMALGAQPNSVVGTVVGKALWQVLAGVSGGIVIAFAAGRAMASLLYATSPQEPWIYIASVITIFLTAVFASALPASRAVSVDPMDALRME